MFKVHFSNQQLIYKKNLSKKMKIPPKKHLKVILQNIARARIQQIFIKPYRGAGNMKSYPPAAGQRKGQAGPIATASIIVNPPLPEQPVKR